MTMSLIWTLAVAVSVLFGAASGNLEAVGTAAFEGAESAVKLMLSLGGLICLWNGVLEVMSAAGITAALQRALTPLLKRLFRQSANRPDILEAVSANVAANALGLGNAATPSGIKAATLMSEGQTTASDDLCTLTVLNTASVQLIPTTAAALRASCGSAAPMDIIVPVWITSIASVSAGLAAAALLRNRRKIRRR